MDPELATHAFAHLLHPSRLYTSAEASSRPSTVPAEPGVYAWYFDEPPEPVPLHGCHQTEEGWLLYVGITPKAPPRNGVPASRQNLRTRVRYPYRGNAEGSTLRLTLGALLADRLGVALRRVGSGKRLTFGQGEAVLSEWMAQHARVCWMVTETPWLLESQLIRELDLPLNLDQNRQGAFHAQLTAARAGQRASARALPILSTV